jgi:putative transposase
MIALKAQQRKKPAGVSWRMDETYVRAKGKWVYPYRAADKFGSTLDFMLSERQDEPAATKFFAKV